MDAIEHIEPWFTLKSVPGIGNHLFKRLIEKFRLPGPVLAASPEALLQVEGVTSRLVQRIKAQRLPGSMRTDMLRALESGYRIITLADPAYPPLLCEIPDPPPFLYVWGAIPDTTRTIAVVGSRNATDYGKEITQRLCCDLAQLGFTIVSGMARGIDTAAHQGALMGQGLTLAVLGSGFERLYPRENRGLARRISENGAVITEFALVTEPEAHNFPTRNRIISGISLGTVIVEATGKSGSLITARLAAEQNREVFAVPGSIESFKSVGTHKLLKQGAKLVEHAQDIVEEFPALLQEGLKPDMPQPAAPAPMLSSAESSVCQVLEAYPLHIDTLVRKTAMEPGRLASILLGLELKGIVRQHPGKRFSICEVKD